MTHPSHTKPAAPSAWVERFAALIPEGGAALDLAAGSGRHARFLLERGHAVVAVDRAPEGLADLAGTPGLEIVAADLETAAWPLEGRRFAGIVVTNYLHRPLFDHLVASLEPGGALIYETFAVGNAAFGRPGNPDFLLRPNELIEILAPRLMVVAYEHGFVEQPRPAVTQRIAAVNGPIRLPPGI